VLISKRRLGEILLSPERTSDKSQHIRAGDTLLQLPGGGSGLQALHRRQPVRHHTDKGKEPEQRRGAPRNRLRRPLPLGFHPQVPAA
jgi:hypothetical protein